MAKRALITGITGQDGSYLAEHLLGLGYGVHGIVRRTSNSNTERIDHIAAQLTLHRGDLADGTGLCRIVGAVHPDEVYNLAAQSHVRVSFDAPEYTFDATATGTMRLLEAVRQRAPLARFYQASSSEMFGLVQETPQRECTPFYPRSPYACAKLAAHWATINYRESYGMHASSGILFNHESPRRGIEFVTRKIARAAARIEAGLQKELRLGNLDSKRDWGHAKDYVRAMHLMLQQEQPGDYVIATGCTFTVRHFLQRAFEICGLRPSEHVVFDESLVRPAEVDLLLGDASKARRILGWQPEYNFEALVNEMVQAERSALSTGCVGAG